MTQSGEDPFICFCHAKCLMNSNHEPTAKLGTESAQKWKRTGDLANPRMEFQKERSSQPES